MASGQSARGARGCLGSTPPIGVKRIWTALADPSLRRRHFWQFAEPLNFPVANGAGSFGCNNIGLRAGDFLREIVSISHVLGVLRLAGVRPGLRWHIQTPTAG